GAIGSFSRMEPTPSCIIEESWGFMSDKPKRRLLVADDNEDMVLHEAPAGAGWVRRGNRVRRKSRARDSARIRVRRADHRCVHAGRGWPGDDRPVQAGIS